VWFRRILRPWLCHPLITQDNNCFISGEIKNFIEGLLFSLNAVWVNPIDAVFKAEKKVYQLSIAGKHGLHVPETIASNNPEEIRLFASAHKDIICKPIYHGLFVEKGKKYSIHATKIPHKNLINDIQLEACPVLIQELVNKKADVRLTIVGERAFAVKITTPTCPDVVDWRKYSDLITYEVIDFDNSTISNCKKMLRELGLIYGAFDFAITHNDEPYFLEVNPTGEWAWLENQLDIPIRDALIELLHDGK
jgi:glutathione synthase/RimK-type ligase-like ATP-grasp enzyme